MIKNKKGLIITVLLALAATAVIYIVLVRAVEQAPVIVAKNHLQVGVVIQDSDLMIQEVSISAIPKSSFKSKDQVIGSTVIAGPIIAGDIVRAEHLADYGSLYAALQTFAPEGWVAVELPGGAGIGMNGLRRGDRVDVIGEIPFKEGFMVDYLVKNAVILSTPWSGDDKAQQFIIAVPPEYAKTIAETVVRNKVITITLPGIIETSKVSKEIIEETIDKQLGEETLEGGN